MTQSEGWRQSSSSRKLTIATTLELREVPMGGERCSKQGSKQAIQRCGIRDTRVLREWEKNSERTSAVLAPGPALRLLLYKSIEIVSVSQMLVYFDGG